MTSEAALGVLATELGRKLGPRDWVLLEGPMGAGKTTFAKYLLEARGVRRPPEGSPTFALAHEYRGDAGDLVHMDLYRLRSAAELDEAGIPDFFWARDAVVICEWLSMWPVFEAQVRAEAARGGRVVYQVELSFGGVLGEPGRENEREVRITRRDSSVAVR